VPGAFLAERTGTYAGRAVAHEAIGGKALRHVGTDGARWRRRTGRLRIPKDGSLGIPGPSLISGAGGSTTTGRGTVKECLKVGRRIADVLVEESEK